MKTFTVYKSSFDGMSGGGELNQRDLQKEFFDSRGWGNLQELRSSIRKWASQAKPGQTFATAFSVIVCVSSRGQEECECRECLSDDIEWEEICPVEGGDIEQKATCNSCGAKWIDVWSPSERRELVKD